MRLDGEMGESGTRPETRAGGVGGRLLGWSLVPCAVKPTRPESRSRSLFRFWTRNANGSTINRSFSTLAMDMDHDCQTSDHQRIQRCSDSPRGHVFRGVAQPIGYALQSPAATLVNVGQRGDAGGGPRHDLGLTSAGVESNESGLTVAVHLDQGDGQLITTSVDVSAAGVDRCLTGLVGDDGKSAGHEVVQGHRHVGGRSSWAAFKAGQGMDDSTEVGG